MGQIPALDPGLLYFGNTSISPFLRSGQVGVWVARFPLPPRSVSLGARPVWVFPTVSARDHALPWRLFPSLLLGHAHTDSRQDFSLLLGHAGDEVQGLKDAQLHAV